MPFGAHAATQKETLRITFDTPQQNAQVPRSLFPVAMLVQWRSQDRRGSTLPARGAYVGAKDSGRDPYRDARGSNPKRTFRHPSGCADFSEIDLSRCQRIFKLGNDLRVTTSGGTHIGRRTPQASDHCADQCLPTQSPQAAPICQCWRAVPRYHELATDVAWHDSRKRHCETTCREKQWKNRGMMLTSSERARQTETLLSLRNNHLICLFWEGAPYDFGLCTSNEGRVSF
jgi:hypothetical protein